MRSRFKKLLKRSLLFVLLLIAAVVLTGIIYEQISRRHDLKDIAHVGRSVDIGGRALNIYCSGEGSPTVIFESGAGSPGYTWVNVQAEVAKITRACWYDRAGYGWSDPGPPPRTSVAIANDLHALLTAAAIAPPYVLVAASFGGFPARVFAGQYPKEVAGVILVDATHEDQHEPDSMKAPVNRLPVQVHNVLCALVPAAGAVGLVRVMMPTQLRPLPGMTSDQAHVLQLLSQQPKTVVSNEGCHWQESAEQARAAGTLGDRPLIVLSAGEEFIPPDPVGAGEAQAFHETWVKQLQPALARLSTNGRQVIVEKSGHGIQFEAPEAVLNAVVEMLKQIKNPERQPTNLQVSRSKD